MEKKFGVLVLGEEIPKKLYSYLDAEIEAKRLVKKLNKMAYIFEVHSSVEPSVKVTKIENFQTLNSFQVQDLFDNSDCIEGDEELFNSY